MNVCFTVISENHELATHLGNDLPPVVAPLSRSELMA